MLRLFREGPLAQYIVDERAQVADWNRAFQHLFAGPSAIRLGCAARRFRERFVSQAGSGDLPEGTRLLMEHPRYGTMRCRAHVRPLRNEGGAHVHWRVSLDVVEWQHREHDLHADVLRLLQRDEKWAGARARMQGRIARTAGYAAMVEALQKSGASRILQLRAGPTSDLAAALPRNPFPVTLHEDSRRHLKALARQRQAPVLAGHPDALDNERTGTYDAVVSTWAGFREDFECEARAAARLLAPGGRFFFLGGTLEASSQRAEHSATKLRALAQRHGLIELQPLPDHDGPVAFEAVRAAKPRALTAER